MYRYLTAVAIACLVLAVALKSRSGATAAERGPETGVTVSHEHPQVAAVRGADGTTELTVTHRLAASVSRASLVYELKGERHTLDMSDCQKSLARHATSAASTEIELSGTLPAGAKKVQLVLEDETGTRVVPIELG